MSKLDKDDVLAKFTEAYKAVNGKEPQIESKSGWYSVDGGKNIRLAQLAEMTESMTGSTTTTEAAQAVEADEKVAEKPVQSTKPAKADKLVVKSGGFSVKNFWVSKIAEENAGANTPR